MKIDGNELAIQQNELDRQGHRAEAMAIKREFLKQVRGSGTTPPAPSSPPLSESGRRRWTATCCGW